MRGSDARYGPEVFSSLLYEKMKGITAGVEEMELYEFRYALHNLYPEQGGWAGVRLDEMDEVEKLVERSDFYSAVQLRPLLEGRIVLDAGIVRLTTMLFAGLVAGKYPAKWVTARFSFDVRGFFFLHRTLYFTDAVVSHFGGAPWRSFQPTQQRFERSQAIGYKDFKKANEEVDRTCIESIQRLITVKGTPILIAIAGPTAAGKTEIVERLRAALTRTGKQVTSIEMDNFLTDRDDRERKGIDSLGREAIHFELFKRALQDMSQGKRIAIPQYDFVLATSSHDASGSLKPGSTPLEIEPADIVFVEGNFPFLLEEIAHLMQIKVVYLTDDEIRMKRKWRRDIDYRKKYEPTYFRNRFFKDQLLMARKCFLPQLSACDIAIDTTGAAMWATPAVARLLDPGIHASPEGSGDGGGE